MATSFKYQINFLSAGSDDGYLVLLDLLRSNKHSFCLLGFDSIRKEGAVEFESFIFKYGLSFYFISFDLGIDRIKEILLLLPFSYMWNCTADIHILANVFGSDLISRLGFLDVGVLLQKSVKSMSAISYTSVVVFLDMESCSWESRSYLPIGISMTDVSYAFGNIVYIKDIFDNFEAVRAGLLESLPTKVVYKSKGRSDPSLSAEGLLEVEDINKVCFLTNISLSQWLTTEASSVAEAVDCLSDVSAEFTDGGHWIDLTINMLKESPLLKVLIHYLELKRSFKDLKDLVFDEESVADLEYVSLRYQNDSERVSLLNLVKSNFKNVEKEHSFKAGRELIYSMSSSNEVSDSPTTRASKRSVNKIRHSSISEINESDL